MAKKKKGKKKNPARMTITNKKKGKKKRRRNPKFLGGATKRFGTDAKEAAQVLGGRYVGEVAAIAGQQFLGGTAGEFAGTVGQVGIWFALTKLVKGPMGRLMRLGLLSEAIHQGLVLHAGIDIPGQIANLLPAPAAAVPAPAAPGASGMGVLTQADMSEDFDGDDDFL